MCVAARAHIWWSWSWLLLAACTTAAQSLQPRVSNACVARIDLAEIVGHNAVESEVCEFLGIPYASPPVGNLRFAPPAPLSGNENLTAHEYGHDCPQNPAAYFEYPNATDQYRDVYAAFVNQLNNTQSEDCLTLNVWNKVSSVGAVRKPVIVFIYGGRFSAGTSNTPFYRGDLLAQAQDVVVVTFNFRMNIFGFPGSPEATQNLAFLDQYAAVQWVSNNIETFGGDASRITIVGQSSGAYAVSNWPYAFQDNPLVAGLAAHSGNIFAFAPNPAEVAAQAWFNVTAQLGCGSSGATLECMRSPNITMAAILAAARRAPTPPGSSVTRSLPAFQATIDNTTVFDTSEYLRRIAVGELARTPYLSVVNDFESGFYRISALAQGNTLLESDWAAFELETFTCSTAFESNYRERLKIPTYRGRHMADWENVRLYNGPPTSGAYHGSELESIIGNSQYVSGGLSPSPQQVKLTGLMQEAWAAFAADPEQGLAATGWSRYSLNCESLALWGVNTTARPELVLPGVYDDLCSSLDLGYEVASPAIAI